MLIAHSERWREIVPLMHAGVDRGLKATSLSVPAMVGREREVQVLMQFLDSAFEGKGTTVFVSGEAGSGKTRLVREFLGILEGKEVAVLSGSCLSDVAVPYFPFMEAFGSYFAVHKDRQDEGGIWSWLNNPSQSGRKTGKAESLTPQAWKDLTFVTVTQGLLSMAAEEPIVLFLEDVHWADSASLGLLHYISRAVGSARVLVLATFRSEELTADDEGHQHPLVESMRLMARENLYREIRLCGLTKEYVSEIARAMVGGDVESGLLEKLDSESRGNALFVVESLRMLVERNGLSREGNIWRLSIDELGVPNKFKDIILRRLGNLKVSHRRVLDMASVIGDKFDPELLALVLDLDILDVLESLNATAQSTSLVHVEGDFYRFDHAKTRRILYDEIPSPLKKGYHARVAQRLESKGASGKGFHLVDLAYHYSQAGNKEKAVEYALQAGEEALAMYSNLEAVKHFNFVLQMISQDSERGAQKIKALQSLGEAYFADSKFGEALKMFEQIHKSETGIAKLRAYRWALDSAFFKGDTLLLVELAKQAEECATIDRIECARVRMNRGRSFLLLGKTKEGLAYFEEALRVDEEEYALADTARTLVGLGPAYSANNQSENALVASLRAIGLYEELNDLRGEMDACNRTAQYGFVALAEEAENMFVRAIRIGEKIGDYNRVAEASSSLSQLYERKGDINKALAQSLKALEYCRKTDSTWTLGSEYANLVRQYAKLGDTVRAEECLDKFLKHEQSLPSHSTGLFHNRKIVQEVLSKATLYAAQGHWKESKHYFDEVFESFNMRHGFSALVSRTYVWALEKQGLIEEAHKIKNENLARLAEVLKRYENFRLKSHLMLLARVGVGQSFEARLDVVNTSRARGFLLGVEGLPLTEFRVSFENNDLPSRLCGRDLRRKAIDPFGLATFKFGLQALTPGVFNVRIKVAFADDCGKIGECQSNEVQVTVSPTVHGRIDGETVSVPILTGRVTTGTADLDVLLYGGIPEGYAVMLSASPSDERRKLVESFAALGVKSGEPMFYLTSDVGEATALAAQGMPNLYLFVCSPRAEAVVQGQQNIFVLKGVENLTDLDIALVKAFRLLNSASVGVKRAWIGVVSDILLQNKAVVTRKWLSGLLADLKTRRFTTLAVIDPQMHSKEEVQAVASLFEGELRVSQSESPEGGEKRLKVVKLYNKDYLGKELILRAGKSQGDLK